ncbi:hypothetical protein JYU34_006765 [Plutella xylostella]|uniref:Uncharacterized protein n=1 Tax=Plutella xylostella TaxID=51655 RepID=A0ABQ7QST5_PLUXY|nr:hypothetical protein JYU34_006765 [Plutella xylostella]
MTKSATLESNRSPGDSEVGSLTPFAHRNRISAILCPVVCAILLVTVFAATYVVAKVLYEQYEAACLGTPRKYYSFDIVKLYIFPLHEAANDTITVATNSPLMS